MTQTERVDDQPAFVLRRQPFRETSLLVELVTRDAGRVGLVARGARSARSRRRAVLQAFTPLRVGWSSRGDLGTLADVEAAGAPIALQGERQICGWYLNELLLRLLQRRDPHDRLFDVYATTLSALIDDAPQIVLRRFERALLEETGYGLDFPPDLRATTNYRYHAQAGRFVPDETSPGTYSGSVLIALRDDALDESVDLRQVRRLMREALRPHLGDTPLKSAQALAAMRRTAPNSPVT